MARSPDKKFAAALALITLIGPLAVHLFLPVMPEIKLAFSASDALVELTFSVTLFAMAFVTLAYGTLSDRYGRRPALLSGLALFLLGSLLSLVAVSVPMLIAGRLIQALGAGSGVTLARAIARDAYGPEQLINAIAYLTMAYTLGPMVAPALGGLLIDGFGWRSVFWFAFGFGALIALAAYFILFETREKRDRPPRSGNILRDYVALFSRLRFTCLVLQSAFCSGTFFAIATASPFLMKEVLGRSATEYGLYFFLFPAGYFVGNLLSTRFSGRVSIETMVLTGSFIQIIAIAIQTSMILAGYLTPLLIFVPGLVVTFSQGLALPNAQAGAIQIVPTLAGTAAGVGAFMQMLGSAVFSQIYGLVADGTPTPMIAIASFGAVATMIVGTIPFLLRQAKPQQGG